ncbi:MAG: acyl-CoA dehydrogenase family protein [Acidimicrobiia bacterium]
MDFDLSEDQLALQDGARALLDDLAATDRVRRVAETSERWDRDLWQAMVDQGWLGIAVPESEGGVGLGPVELGVLLEEIGRHVAPAPFLPTVLALEVFRRVGDVRAVERILGGDVRACIAWSRRPASVLAEPADGEWVLTGRPDPVPYASVADLALVLATDGDGPALFGVDLDLLGRPSAEPAMDLTRPIAWVELDRTPAWRLGGVDMVNALLDMGATATALEMLGGASRVLELAVDYAKERVQFGRPIGSFQAVKHRCADMLVDVEGMRSTSYWAAWCLAADDADQSIAASTAKTWGSDASKRVMAGALQVHGGIGFTWEHDLHLYLKRAQLDQVSFGDAVAHRERLARLLRPRVDAGESVV